MTDILEVAQSFGVWMRAHTEKYLTDYRAEHRDDDPDVVTAYCDGFRDASMACASVMVTHVLARQV